MLLLLSYNLSYCVSNAQEVLAPQPPPHPHWCFLFLFENVSFAPLVSTSQLTVRCDTVFLGLLYVYTCDWNYRPDHCMYGNNCGAAKGNGISVVHGNRGVFHNDKQVFFKAIYNTLRDFKPGENITLLATRLSENLKSVGTDPYCNAMVDSVLKYPKKYSVLWKLVI